MIRPLHDWVLVRLDPLSEMCGSLYAPSAARVRTATVLRVGPGKVVGIGRAPVGLEPGDRVAFYREHLEHLPGQAVRRILSEHGEDEVGMLRAPDVLFAFEAKGRFQ
ncbi:hypothetical protein LVJ94_35285 [Pendulispora rubella]|uniref:10 kDa chaperonin n=1 Tax=Pendulispora rubella TaxID=2741070 RepID=A0ABZ2KU18_9BACT